MHPGPTGHLAIDGIKGDVDAQTQPYQSRFLVREQSDVYADGQQRVQRVKADAAATWIVDWICSQVVNIDQHPDHHEGKRLHPARAVKDGGRDQRYDEMKQ
jgi:hypothetical protein